MTATCSGPAIPGPTWPSRTAGPPAHHRRHARSGATRWPTCADDSVMSNCHRGRHRVQVDHHQVQLHAPFLRCAPPTGASHTCRHRCTSSISLLSTMRDARDAADWSAGAAGGDDGDDRRRRRHALLGLGADLDGFNSSSRTATGAEGGRRCVDPLDELDGQIAGRAAAGRARRPPGERGAPSVGALQGPATSATCQPGGARRHVKAGQVINGYTHPGGLPGRRRRAEQVDLRRARRPRILHQGVPQPDLP